jgi:hypothetical protein
MQMKWFSLFVCAAFLSACATPYQPMSALGGYREIQLAPDIYRVMFFGNGYTNSELAVEYALRRCAELTQQNGYRYFGILAVNDLSEQRSWNIPGSAYNREPILKFFRQHCIWDLQSDDIHHSGPDDTVQFPAPGDHHADGQ